MQIQTLNFGEVTLLNFIDASRDELLYLLKMRNHPDIKKWMYNQEDISEQQHFDFVEKLKSDELKKYFIVKQNQSIVGSINFININQAERTADFGLYANPFASTPGAGRILEEIAIQYAQDVLKLKYLKLEVFEQNARAINFYEKSGFTKTAEKLINDQNVLCMQKQVQESEGLNGKL
jgi:UDP-4-amino-4,6-dideoxy-N-acetyl-beta-L-altrosamine N-acetyltransferase